MANQTINIQHPIRIYGQPTGMTCWSAATTMLFGTNQSIGPGGARLGASGGLQSDYANISAFARAHSLTMYAPQSWAVEGLINLMRRGPAAMMGAMPSLHAIVIGGIQSDGTPQGTTLTIYDPWPPNIGNVRTERYDQWMQRYPLSTMYMLQR